MRRTILLLTSTLLAASACDGGDKSGEGKAEGGDGAAADGLDEGDKMVLESSKKDLQRAKDMHAKGEDAKYACAAAGGMIDDYRTKKTAKAMTDHIADIDKTCSYDIPLDVVGKEVEKAEAARKAKPDETVLSECHNATYELALDELKEHKHAEDDKVKALIKRFETACPKS